MVARSKAPIPLSNPRDLQLWKNAWCAASTGSLDSSTSPLLQMYMRLPAASQYAPEPENVWGTILRAVKAANSSDVLFVTQIAADVIEHRLLPNPTNIHCLESITELRLLVPTVLAPVAAASRTVAQASRLLAHLLMMMGRAATSVEDALNLKTSEFDSATGDEVWMGWQKPTLFWLQKGKWLSAPHFTRSYESLESYIETIRRTMVMLTFYWGAGALFPKCKFRRDAGRDAMMCNQPLCAPGSTGQQVFCDRKSRDGVQCGRPALWKCHFKGHDGICSRCIVSVQATLTGKPGRHASTDIYDASVDRESHRRDGHVYVCSEVISRKPPEKGVNWRTTYRLKCAALVGVVRLAFSGQPLSSEMAVEWAEIVPLSTGKGYMEDYRARQNCTLAIRLLTRNDLSLLKADSDGLQVGGKIALIDMQVFIPEVVPVLAAIADPSLEHHLQGIKFSSLLAGASSDFTEDFLESNIREMIRKALDHSKMDILSRITNKDCLIDSISELAKRTKLDGTQFSAFCSALADGLHCTQGPPGTGKSYLGVALIRAFDMIRTFAQSSNVNVGPIVVLAYKNHALDEILLDVLKSNSFSQRGALIRCGKPEKEELKSHVEWRSDEERRAEKFLDERISSMRAFRRSVKDLRALHSALTDSSGDALRFWTPSQTFAQSDASSIAVATQWMIRLIHLDLSLRDIGERLPDASECFNSLSASFGKHLVSHDFAAGVADHVSDIDMHKLLDKIVLRDICQLEQGNEHWVSDKKGSRTEFLLSNWLLGENPPPRCLAFKEEACIFAVRVEGQYCNELHACQYKGGCPHKRHEKVSFCSKHRCLFGCEEKNVESQICWHPRMKNSRTCNMHSCQICISLDSAVIERKIVDACEEHSCHFDGCWSAISSILVPFCQKHACDACNHFSKTDPKQVKSMVVVERFRYCVDHKCLWQSCGNFRNVDSDVQQNFCASHCCEICTGTRQLVSSDLPRVNICDGHRCSHNLDRTRCLHVRTSELFCDNHTCKVCKSKGLSLKKRVIDDPPRNVCSEHRLCSFISHNGEMCSEEVTEPTLYYCNNHLNRKRNENSNAEQVLRMMQCEGMNKRKKRCGTKGPCLKEPYYCDAHFDQRPESDGESTNSSVEDEDDSEQSTEDYDGTQEGEFENRFGGFDSSTIINRFRASAKAENAVKSENVLSDLEVMNERFHRADESVPGTSLLSNGKVDSPMQQLPVERENDDYLQDGDKELPAIKAELCTEQVDLGPINDLQVPSGEMFIGQVEGVEPDVTNHDYVQSSSSEDEGNDKSGNDIPLDELDVCDFEVPENMQHLYEIADHNDGAESSSDEEEPNAPQNIDIVKSGNFVKPDLSEWTWETSQQKRWELARSFVAYSISNIDKMINCAEQIVDEDRKNLAETSASSLKRARVIGATVVGAIRRLHAIRASEPFAMVVEEACEVMEPTLLSVLAVRSLQKLELIGDHRQLPAFIHQCWFNAQLTNPSLQISLFERLVENKSSPLTILDVQRRMRSEICDLTRKEYEDVTNIKDDPCTRSQLIADRILRDSQKLFGKNTKIKKERDSWVDSGMLVPGILPQVYFWNLESEEGKAAVGLSRCNEKEAKACVALTQWLISCGVPAQAITIITPYKGQVMTILKKLRAEKWYEENTVFVSSVDRYQGDENDIVILSLVSTKPGNRFVAFRNRFIVAASRARIGFYIIGNSGAVTKGSGGANGPRHWQRLLNDLQAGFSTDEPRIGKTLKICCPRHRSVTKTVSTANDFPSSKIAQDFCKELCTFQLDWCGHRCSLPCHNTSFPHREKCEETVERYCEKHADIPLKCHVVLKDFAGNVVPNFRTGLQQYKCEVMVKYNRPECSHVVDLQCGDHVDVLDGVKVLPECDCIVTDFVHPSCGHVVSKPKCFQRRKWETTPPPCKITVKHERICGCKVMLPCGDALKEMALDAPPTCNVAVDKPRPRCSHRLSCRCNEMTRLMQLWDDGEGDGVTGDNPIVYHGTVYGPSESEMGAQFRKVIPECMVKTEYYQSCGHTTYLRCNDAFLAAAGKKEEPRCTELTKATSPLCGHAIDVGCYLKEFMSTVPVSLFVEKHHEEIGTKMTASEETLVSAGQPNSRLRKIAGNCNQHVIFERRCGHISKPILCSSLFSVLMSKKLPDCKVAVELDRECEHRFRTECFKSAEPMPSCEAPIDDVYVYPLCTNGHSVRPGVCRKLRELRALDNPPCPVELDCTRPRCHHTVKIACHLEDAVLQEMVGDCATVIDNITVVDEGNEYRKSEVGVKDCTEPVLINRECGHQLLNIPCFNAFKWVAYPDDMPPCHDMVTIPSPLCGHDVTIQCFKADEIKNTVVWENGKLDHITESVGESDNIGSMPVVTDADGVPIWSSEISNLQCGRMARFVRKCAHVDDIPCSAIFNAVKSPCQHVLNVTCNDCEQTRRVKCAETLNIGTIPCRNTVRKICSVCGVNEKKVECCQEKVMCEGTVSITLECGHKVSWSCGEESDPRVTKAPCIQCKLTLWKNTLARLKDATGDTGDKRSVIYDVDGSFVVAMNLKRSLQEKVREMDAFSEFIINEVTETDAIVRAENIQNALMEMLGGYVDVLSGVVASGPSENEMEWKELLTVQDVDNSYDFVFLRNQGNKKISESFDPRTTRYGHGSQAMLLNAKSLKEIAGHYSADDGSLVICVAAVLRLRGRKDLRPFCHNPQAKQRKKRRNEGENLRGNSGENNDSNKLAMKLQEQRARGFDHVDVQPKKQDKHTGVLERVYWIPGAVVPLFKMRISIVVECEICMVSMLPQKGWFCKQDHFLCRHCFNNHVQHASQPDALQRSVDEKGNVKCPHDKCDSVYDPLFLATQKHDASTEDLKEMHKGILNIQLARYSKEKVAEALDVQKRKMQAEFDRINQIQDAKEREAERFRVKVVDEILTLRCPNKDCRMAFFEFEGCFAVHCSSCNCNFCAWCLEYWVKGDAHGHVARCDKSLRRGELFGHGDHFKQSQTNWRKENVIKRLKGIVENDVRKKALDSLREDLSSLGVHISERDVNL